MSRYACLCLLAVALVAQPALGASSAFTYQGKLTGSAGIPLTGSYNMTFKLYNALTGGTQVGSTVSLSGISVSGGLFTIQLDFGAVWNGQDRWLETAVAGTTLTPRVPVTSSPSALFSAAPWVTSGNNVSYSAGNVGIGTLDLAPNLPLTLQGTGANCEWIQLRDSTGANKWHINSRSGGINLAESLVADYRLFIEPGGNVGIGTPDPGAKLDVNGAAKMTGFQLGTSVTAGQVLTASASGVGTWQPLPTSLPPSGSAGGDLTGTYPAPTIGTDKIGNTKLASDSASLAKVSGGVMASASGKVGIGTTSPGAILDVNGMARVDGLTASAGGGVSVGADWTYGSPFQVYAPSYTADQQQLTFAGSYYTTGTLWQSFTAGVTGDLAAIQLFVGLYGGGRWSGTLKVFSGEGTGGTLLTSQTIVSNGFAYRLFTLLSPVPLTSGSQYTVAITPMGGVPIDWKRISSDVYAGGRFSHSDAEDAYFITYMATTTASPAVVVQPNTGNVGINMDNPTYKLHVNGSVAGVGAYNQLSDARYKTNVEQISNALRKVEHLCGISFEWKAAEYPEIDFSDGRQVGLLAQEVEKVLPEAVTRSSDGTYSVSYSSLVPLLIEAVKEQQKQMDAKDACIGDLEARLARVEELLGHRR